MPSQPIFILAAIVALIVLRWRNRGQERDVRIELSRFPQVLFSRPRSIAEGLIKFLGAFLLLAAICGVDQEFSAPDGAVSVTFLFLVCVLPAGLVFVYLCYYFDQHRRLR